MRHQVDDTIVALAIINRNIVQIARQISRMEAHMTQEFEELQTQADAISADVANVQDALNQQRTQISELQAQIADLQAQIAAGNPVTAEQLQAVSDQLAAADAALDEATGTPNP